VGLGERADFRPEQLSGGQQQRAALAVALANKPALLLGDEPTGQVDSESAMEVLDALRAINQVLGTTVVLVTHDPLVASRVDRVVTLQDGRTSTEIRRREAKNGTVEEEEWVIVDPAGRLQLPDAHLSTLHMSEWVRVHLEPDHISIWPWQGGTGRVREAAADVAATNLWQLAGVQTAGMLVATESLTRTFALAGGEVRALRGVSLSIPAGSLTVIKGPSGSGKTTLLNLIAGLDEPTSGTLRLGDRSLGALAPQELINLRCREIGYVFQTFGLLPSLTVEENIQVPLRLLNTAVRKRRALVDQVLNLVGLAERAQHRSYELSGGEQQRVAIARALVKGPSLILADEPTGQLDSRTGAGIIALLKEISIQTGATVIVASHDPKVHEAADQVFELKDGSLVR
jgi:ABC-type lipoprotein export system ATPase subunit